MEKTNNIGAPPKIKWDEAEGVTLRDLIMYHRSIKGECLKCEAVDFCNQYTRYMATLSPDVWMKIEEATGMEAVPLIRLERDGYINLKERHGR